MKNYIKILVVLMPFINATCTKEENPETTKLIKSVAVNNRVIDFVYDSDNRLIKRTNLNYLGIDSFSYKDDKVFCYVIISYKTIIERGYFSLNSENLATSYYNNTDSIIEVEFDYNDNRYMTRAIRYRADGRVHDTVNINYLNDSLITINDDSLILNQNKANFEQNLLYPYDIRYQHRFGPVIYSPISYIGLPFLGKGPKFLISYSNNNVNSGMKRTNFEYEYNTDGTVSAMIIYAENTPEYAVRYAIVY